MEHKIPDVTNLATKTTEGKVKITSFSNLATTTFLTTVGNKIPNVSNLVKNKKHKY